jgi:UPF0042 nucleotide-binding protein
MELVVISGLSGSGKSIALAVLEDAGYYCVDNLPADMLPVLVGHLQRDGYTRVGVAVDVRSGPSLEALPKALEALRRDAHVSVLFLDADDETLLQRFSETRRAHPLTSDTMTLAEALRHERALLEPVAEMGHRLDTSHLKPAILRAWIRDFLKVDSQDGLTLVFESFGFKHGVPRDADLMFDVRCLPNPHYDPTLRPLTGRDMPVAAFLESQPDALKLREDIARFVKDWLPKYGHDNRSYLTVAIGCTGGQHRSVWMTEWLATQFADRPDVLVRHRELSPQTPTPAATEKSAAAR